MKTNLCVLYIQKKTYNKNLDGVVKNVDFNKDHQTMVKKEENFNIKIQNK